MARPKSKNPTDREMAILRILWDNGPLTVRQINKIINQTQKTGYTTTLKIMQIMLDKELLKRDMDERPHLYTPAVAEDCTQKQVVSEVIDKVFGGSAKKLVMQALSSQKVTPDEMVTIRKMLDEMEGE